MTMHRASVRYFPHSIPISAEYWQILSLENASQAVRQKGIPEIVFFRQLALRLNRAKTTSAQPVHAAHLNLFATLQNIYRYIIDVMAEETTPGTMIQALQTSGKSPADKSVSAGLAALIAVFPPEDMLQDNTTAQNWLKQPAPIQAALRELLLLRIASENPALDSFREILDDRSLAETHPHYAEVAGTLMMNLGQSPYISCLEMTLLDALKAPLSASPDSLAGQVGYIRDHWQALLPPELLEEVTIAFDILLEEERERAWGGEPGPPPVLEFARPGGFGSGDGSSIFGGYDYPEYERFSSDVDWMPNVVLMAKMVYVWLGQLTKTYGYPVTRLDQIPDSELDRLAAAGFTGLWLIGIWERSPASQRIKQLCGNPEAIASAYSLYDYEIAEDLGGWEALANLRERAIRRGIRLASDMVPNHTGIYSRWVIQHPDWFIQTDYPPFPTYQFNGEDLSQSPDAVIQVEDGYWTKTDAAVVFRHIDRNNGRVRYIYHGNDGTSIPWNDTAQLNYLLPEVREAVIRTILHVAHNFPIIRFDAAMTLAKKHYQRLWFPIRGLGGGIPSRAEHGMTREEFDALFPVEFWREVVDRVAAEAPGTLLLAEAFWLMEGYFVRTLGMHRVYNSAFMNMLKTEENAKYRQTIKNVLEFNPEVLKRFVNFMNNPDEKTAVEQFGSQGKYFGSCVLLSTMPGLPMFGHGQIEGYKEKYGMEYKQAYWDEQPDQGLMTAHEMWIFPLLRRRWLFSGSENFALFDFYAGSSVDENVFAYTNRTGNHRALVLYHNKYARTAGWIRESAACMSKNHNGTEELRRTDLASALAISSAEHIYYAFRDVFSGLEYLRSGRELAEKGLYAELGEYECHVFLDFKEIQDDRQHSWSALYAALNGNGVDSLAAAYLQHHYASQNRAYRQLLETATCADAKARHGLVIKAAKDLIPLLKPHLDKALTAEASKSMHDNLTAFHQFSAQLESLATSNAVIKTMQSCFNSNWGCMMMTTISVFSPLPPGVIERFGLDYSLRKILAEQTEDRHPDPDSLVQLTKTLTAMGPFDHQPNTAGYVALLASAFEQPYTKAFLHVHDASGVSWFNKERLEILGQYLQLCLFASTTLKQLAKPSLLNRIRNSAAALSEILALAQHAGYRTAVFIQLLQEMRESTAKTKRTTAAKNQVPISTNKRKQQIKQES